jgi:hypothetical protein
MSDRIDQPLVRRDDRTQIDGGAKVRKQWRAPKVIRSEFALTSNAGVASADLEGEGRQVVIVVTVS